MSCYRPLKAFYVPGLIYRPEDGWPNKSGFEDPDFVRGDVFKIRNSNVLALRKGDLHPIYDSDQIESEDYQRFQWIPCRKCYGCREDSAKMWTDRLMLELENHVDAWFVTLTYDDSHVPRSDFIDENGIVCDDFTLRKKDLQDFFKRLRRRFDPGGALENPDVHIMYYAAGEYGGETLRPHYHAIIYGLPLNDLVEWKRRSGFVYYSSPFLSDVWEHGFVSVSKVTRETAAYTCRYVMKKAFGEDRQRLIDRGLEPEFTLMSKRPAIARLWYEKHVAGKQEDFYGQSIHYITGPESKPISFSIPRYFDDLTQKENDDIIVSVKKKRKRLGESRQKALESQSSKPYPQILADIEADKISRNINFGKSRKRGISYEASSDSSRKGSSDFPQNGE